MKNGGSEATSGTRSGGGRVNSHAICGNLVWQPQGTSERRDWSNTSAPCNTVQSPSWLGSPQKPRGPALKVAGFRGALVQGKDLWPHPRGFPVLGSRPWTADTSCFPSSHGPPEQDAARGFESRPDLHVPARVDGTACVRSCCQPLAPELQLPHFEVTIIIWACLLHEAVVRIEQYEVLFLRWMPVLTFLLRLFALLPPTTLATFSGLSKHMWLGVAILGSLNRKYFLHLRKFNWIAL